MRPVPELIESLGLDVGRIRQDFPVLRQRIYGKPLVYLDNAATTQKPQQVIERLSDFYAAENANIHRGVHQLSQKATQAYEEARRRVQRFLNAARASEIIFVRGTTEAINLVSQSYARKRLRPGSEIILSTLEHHSNIVPWQIVCQQTDARLRVVPMSDSGELLLQEYEKLLNSRTALVSITHVSNALGTINPVKTMIEMAHGCKVPVMVDGAQAVSHRSVDVRELDCDFYAFSGHKLYGPTGVGILYAKAAHLEDMPPYQGGGEMIRSVTFEKTIYDEPPQRFEAGTPNIAGAIGLATAIDYVQEIGLGKIASYEGELLSQASQLLGDISRLRLVGTAREKASVLSFVIDGIHPHDLGTILDQEGIAIRTGHHCAQPLMDRLGVPATARASLAFYNTREEIEALARGIEQALELFT